MDITSARIVLGVITAVEVLVWLTGASFLIASRRTRRPHSSWADDAGTRFEDHVDGWLSGEVEVEGEPAVLASRAARLLAQGSQQLGPVKVLDLADDRVRFERVGLANTGGQWFRRGELRFAALDSGHSRVSWLVEPAASAWMLALGWAFQGVGFVAMAVGSWAVYTYLASSPEPAARWQTFQMLQAIHFLWPPFLFGALYRAGGRSVRAQFETLTQNLPYVEA